MQSPRVPSTPPDLPTSPLEPPSRAAGIASRVSGVLVASACVALAITLAIVVTNIAALEARELDERGEVLTLSAFDAAPRVMVVAELEQGEDAVFELCSSDAMGQAWGQAAHVELRVGEEIALETTLDETARARARTNASGACLEIGRGTLEQSGVYSIAMARVAELPDARVRARIVARRPLGARERQGVRAVLGLALVLVVLLAMRTPRVLTPRRGPPRRSRVLRLLRVRARRATRAHPLVSALALVTLGTALVVLAGIATPLVLPGGAAYGLVAGLVLALAEVALAWALLAPDTRPGTRGRSITRTERLGLTRPHSLVGSVLYFFAAPLVGLALCRFAIWSLSNVEATGEAPIEAFVSWPSGMLSFAALAVIAPIAEEIFFRGFVFGAVDDGRWGARRVLAVVLAWGLFTLAHLQQAWGNWGGMLAVAVAGACFTLLRAVSGSTLVPALAHLVYNALLSMGALAAVAVMAPVVVMAQ